MPLPSRRLFLAALAPARRKVQVIAHRGEHAECPENTLPAIRKAIELGCDWVELDVRTTRDGHFVLMHNATVDATTDGQGAVADLTLAEMRRLDAGARKPRYRGTPVPTLDEALTAFGGRGGIYFDAKKIPASAIVEHLERHRMMERALVYGSVALLKELPRGLAMPEAVDLATLRRTLHELTPRVIAFDRRDFEAEAIALARSGGHEVFVDRLGEDDTPERWAEAIRKGATGIQTDRPAELIDFLRRQG